TQRGRGSARELVIACGKGFIHTCKGQNPLRVLLRITPKGERLHRKIIPLFQQREQEILSALNSEERKQLDHLLGKLASAVQN
ncbi:MAG: MarR family winged helix-turn-helix transcriptional regulator, partial [Pseudomonadota bacterium]